MYSSTSSCPVKLEEDALVDGSDSQPLCSALFIARAQLLIDSTQRTFDHKSKGADLSASQWWAEPWTKQLEDLFPVPALPLILFGDKSVNPSIS